MAKVKKTRVPEGIIFEVTKLKETEDASVIITTNGRKLGRGRDKDNDGGVTGGRGRDKDDDGVIIGGPGHDIDDDGVITGGHGRDKDDDGVVIGGPGTGFDGGQDLDDDNPGGDTTQDEEKEDEDNKKGVPLGKLAKKAAFGLLLFGMLVAMAGVVTAKDVVYDGYTESSQQESVLISDLDLQYSGEEGAEKILPSQIPNPGKLISDARERKMGESLVRQSAREEYDEIEAVNEEDQINEITENYEALLEQIKEQEDIIKSETATPEEKLAATQELKRLSGEQLKFYEESAPLFTKYCSEAREAYSNPGDERTKNDLDNMDALQQSWDDAIANIETNEQNIDSIIQDALDPTAEFQDVHANSGKAYSTETLSLETYDADGTKYYINFPGVKIFGHELISEKHLFEKENVSTVDEEFSYSIDGEDYEAFGGAVGQGVISEDETHDFAKRRELHGIAAFTNNFRSWGKGLMEKVTGKNLTDPKAPNYEGR